MPKASKVAKVEQPAPTPYMGVHLKRVMLTASIEINPADVEMDAETTQLEFEAEEREKLREALADAGYRVEVTATTTY